jgi:hypothetical protein
MGILPMGFLSLAERGPQRINHNPSPLVIKPLVEPFAHSDVSADAATAPSEAVPTAKSPQMIHNLINRNDGIKTSSSVSPAYASDHFSPGHI